MPSFRQELAALKVKSFNVPARGLIREDSVQTLAIELTLLVLVKGCSTASTRFAVQPPMPPNPSTCQLEF